ncbi:MAG: rod shape-determining protein MreC [Anaerolineae bacterium]|jgi:rod shape-determining protein MreC|nr:rod shape-determining protein MreC [Anaerolineae bacterium]
MRPPKLRPWQIAVILLIFLGVIVLSLSGYLGTWLGTTTGPFVSLQSWVSSRYLRLYDFFTATNDLNMLRQENAALEQENALLQTEVIELQEQLREAEVYFSLLDFARSNPENQYIAALVIGRDPSPFMNYVILDHGSNDGVQAGMPVVTEKGLVGRVDAVTANASRVQLITSIDFQANVQTQETQAEGVLNGSITGELTMSMVSQDSRLQQGDLVLTSGLGGNFPGDVLIGEVGTVTRQENALFQSCIVQSLVDFRSLEVVLIIRNFEPVEIEPLIPVEEP